METFDTVIVGGGTAGLSAGRVLDQHHKNYLIIDTKQEIGKPIRSTGGVAMHFVDKLGMPKDEDVIAAYINSVSLQSDYNTSVDLSFDHPVGLVYDFTKYEKRLAEGLNIQTGRTALDINDHEITTNDGKIRAGNVIIAASHLNRFLGYGQYKVSNADSIIAYEETRKLPPRDDYDLVLWFTKYAPGGYVWDFPDNDNKRRIGLGIVKNSHTRLKNSLMDFTDIHPELAGEIDHTIAHQIPVAPPVKDVVIGNIMVVGDAAHTCFADTGGGLQGAFWSGKMAANAIVQGNRMNYQTEYRSELYKLLKRHYMVKNLLYNVGDQMAIKLFPQVKNYKIKSENATKEIPRLVRYLMLRNLWIIPPFIKSLTGNSSP